MRRWTWLAVLALVAALAIIPWAISAFAHGPADTGNTSQSTEGYCAGGEEMMGQHRGMGSFHMGLANPVTLERVAGTLGLTYDELTARLAQGETIAEIAQAQGVDTALVVTAILAPHSEILQVRVNYGYLSAEEAQAILDQAQLRVEQGITVPHYGPTSSMNSVDTAEHTPAQMHGGEGSSMGSGMMDGGGMMGW